MPKAEPHFDADTLIAEVHKQDIGLRVSTNNPENFKQILYKAARKTGTSIHIYSVPNAPNSLFLLPKEPSSESANAT